MIHKKIRFKGVEYWRNDEFGYDLLSPLHHFSETGELLADVFHDISYAMIEGEDIVRYGECIGNINELEEVNDDKS